MPRAAGYRRTVDGPRTDVSDTSDFVYYPVDPAVPAALRGRLAAARNPAGHVTRYEDHDLFGNPRRVIDPNGVVEERTYDALGRLATSTLLGVSGCDTSADPLCNTDLVASNIYDGAASLTTQVSAAGGVTSYTYDDRGRVLTISRGPSVSDLRERVETTYDPKTGRKSIEKLLAKQGTSWVEKRRTTYRYDLFARVDQITHPGGATVGYSYDAAGRASGIRDENHATSNTHYEYDGDGRVEEVRQFLPSGDVTTTYVYDGHGNLTSVTDPNGNVTTYIYDDFGQMLRQVSPVTGTTTYEYDAGGNLVETSDANGAVTTRAYDILGRVTESTVTRAGGSETVTWTYDSGAFGIGRMASSTDPTGSTTYQYDRRGLLIKEEKTIHGATYVTRFGYDPNGNRTRLVYPSGAIVDYTFDYAGRPLTATRGTTPIVTSVSYLPFGPATQMTFGNGTTKTMTFDQRYRPLTNVLTGPSGTIASYGYAHDPAGNITAITDALDAGYNRTFGYDDLNRLTTANSGAKLWGTGSYQYDAMGNMQSYTLGAKTASFEYFGTTPMLDSVTESGTPRTVGYDAAGNETTTGTSAFTYSPRNQLREDGVYEYGYDARGIRTVATRPGALLSLTLPVEIAGGLDGEGAVTLYSPAPAGGAAVLLAADGTVASVPSSITIPEGAITGTFVVITSAVSTSANVTISATHDGVTLSGTTIVAPPALSALTATGGTIKGGQSLNATVSLDAPAPAGGALVSLSSGDPARLSVPVSVTIPEGTTETGFVAEAPAPVAAETAVSIMADYAGVQRSVVVTVQPPSITSLTLTPPSVEGGLATGAVVELESAAADGTVITFESTSSGAQPPASVIMPGGATSVGAAVITAPVGAISSAVVTAHLPPDSSSATLTLEPASITLDSFVLSATSTVATGTVTGTVTLTAPAPAGGIDVELAPYGDGIVPPFVTVPEGATSATFEIVTPHVLANETLTVSARHSATTINSTRSHPSDGLDRSRARCAGNHPARAERTPCWR